MTSPNSVLSWSYGLPFQLWDCEWTCAYILSDLKIKNELISYKTIFYEEMSEYDVLYLVTTLYDY